MFNLARIQIVDMLVRGVPGNEAAASLERMSPQIYGLLRAYTDETLILSFVNSDPILSKVKDHPRLRTFLAEFLAYTTQTETEAEDAVEKPN